jgi:hypothetical protein
VGLAERMTFVAVGTGSLAVLKSRSRLPDFHQASRGSSTRPANTRRVPETEQSLPTPVEPSAQASRGHCLNLKDKRLTQSSACRLVSTQYHQHVEPEHTIFIL